jgi:hypothetical protein
MAVDDAANRSREPEPPDRASEIKRAEHRSAVRLENYRRARLSPSHGL